MQGDGWEDYLEGRERMDFIKTAQPQWMNLNISDTGRLDEIFDHRAIPLWELKSSCNSLVCPLAKLSY
jgi:hypothetical protein